MAQHRTAHRIAALALALAASAGIGAATIATADTAEAAPVTSAAHWSTTIVNEGEQDAVDACEGGLTLMPSVAKYVGKGYYPIHNECGGAPILDLVDGSTVHIAGLGRFTVIDTLDVMRGDDATVIKALAGDILIQTCHNTGEGMRVVALQAA